MRRDPIFFTIDGKAVGWQRTGHSGHFYTQTKTRDYQKIIASLARQAIGTGGRFPGAVEVKILMQLEPAKSMPKKNRLLALLGKIFPLKKPDVDNVTKSVLDAMNKIVYEDDCQVCRLVFDKVYGPADFVAVTVIDIEAS